MNPNTTTVGDCLPKRPKSGLVGLELEMEFNTIGPFYDARELDLDGAPRAPGPGGQWEITEDGSLRGGIEARFKNPVAFPKVEEQLNLYARWLESHSKKVKPIPSMRCSTHVHMNVSKRTLTELFRLVYASWAVEQGLILTQSPARHNNIYCLPIHRSPDFAEEVSEVIEHGMQPFRLAAEGNRYAATNLNPVSTFGSIEYRFFDGTVDIGKIGGWVAALSQLHEWAAKVPIKEQEELINQSADKYLDLALGGYAREVRDAAAGRTDDLLGLTGFMRQRLRDSVDKLEQKVAPFMPLIISDTMPDLNGFVPTPTQDFVLETDV